MTDDRLTRIARGTEHLGPLRLKWNKKWIESGENRSLIFPRDLYEEVGRLLLEIEALRGSHEAEWSEGGDTVSDNRVDSPAECIQQLEKVRDQFLADCQQLRRDNFPQEEALNILAAGIGTCIWALIDIYQHIEEIRE